ncbi:50S ribosomal protein L19e [uncultured archaeon]|nr:50S ribosomal protein L19e [uncultured archaeon]
MAQNTIRRLSADIMGIGTSRVRFQPDQMARINEALTRDDIRVLIKEGIIYALPARGVSKAGSRARARARRKGRQSGHGNRKGTYQARADPKETWMAKVRSQRSLLRSLKEGGAIQPEAVRKIYTMIKGNAFRGKAVLKTYLKENGLLTASGLAQMNAPKSAPAKPAAKPKTGQNPSAPTGQKSK